MNTNNQKKTPQGSKSTASFTMKNAEVLIGGKSLGSLSQLDLLSDMDKTTHSKDICQEALTPWNVTITWGGSVLENSPKSMTMLSTLIDTGPTHSYTDDVYMAKKAVMTPDEFYIYCTNLHYASLGQLHMGNKSAGSQWVKRARNRVYAQRAREAIRRRA